jgi:hypothetical protein
MVVDADPAERWSPGLGQVVLYRWIPEDRIPLAHRRFVHRHADRAARDLGIEKVRVRWFLPSPETSAIMLTEGPDAKPADLWAAAPEGSGFWGWAPTADSVAMGVCPDDMPMTIALNASLRGVEAVAAVVAHEVRHVAQQAGLTPEERETDADEYAADYMQRFAVAA